ncbi:hypothetical protein EYE42_04100 [Paracoccus subflavus]|uniref:Uncharacterized protein n=1 Tax=Paracoccus subflavus TaxID=2528244 RepID=A0A4Q9G3K2_9RHOB|nr:hypothetical protein [Paracoccus subflavus]TBN42614.1 hypothetical protein EYE42_04100 [Paracoccus subflavus]
MVQEIFDPSQPVITKEMIEKLAYRISHEPIQKRAEEKKITGEWIIFAKHCSRNYYLCLGTHESGDQYIFDRIMQYCTRCFPDLPAWIAAASMKS